jgi:arginine N-succinyltransferase
MVIIRPVRRDDLDQLVDLAGMAGFGLTSLPQDRELLARRIEQSIASFQIRAERPGGELYLFVMDDVDHGRLAGTSCIVSKVGGFEPFWAYEIRTAKHESKVLHICTEVETLHIVSEHSGPSEIGGLFIAPEYRRHGNGRLLSLFRFLFMAARRERFEPLVIAEMRGGVNEDGRSPFWEALGRHFFDMDFPKADYLSVKDKRFIGELMPRCPIYTPLLPIEARRVIGRVQPDTRPALKMLEDEGFTFTGMVDIFEAGPIINCSLNDIRIVRESRESPVEEIAEEGLGQPAYIITNTSEDFRACMGPAVPSPDGGVRVSHRSAEALQLKVGDKVRYGPLRPLTPGKDDQ